MDFGVGLRWLKAVFRLKWLNEQSKFTVLGDNVNILLGRGFRFAVGSNWLLLWVGFGVYGV